MVLTKKIGDTRVPAPGYGAMGASAFYGSTKSEEEAKQVLRDAVAMGCTFWDTADMYGCGHNEEIIGQVLNEGDTRSKVFIATKFGNDFDRKTKELNYGVRGDPAYVRQALEESLKRLNLPHVDLYYQHRVDDKTPIEDTVKTMEELRKEGKLKYLGLSEVSEATLRRAAKVAKIDVIQMEYSPFSLDIETSGVLSACRELGVTVVAYSPLGRGFLTGRFKSPDDFEEGDFRKYAPRFQGENFDKNVKLVHKFEELAKKKGSTSGQLCLAWLMAQGDDIIPIPGTKSTKYLQENFESNKLTISKEEDQEIREIIKSIPISGGRYPDAFADTCDR